MPAAVIVPGVREATSQRRIAESELRQVELQANEAIRSAYLQVQSAETLIAAARKLLESTELTSTAMQRGFELGAVTNVDVLNALRDQFRAERDLQRVRYDHVKYLLLLKREAGLLSADDMLEVGSWLEAAGQLKLCLSCSASPPNILSLKTAFVLPAKISKVEPCACGLRSA